MLELTAALSRNAFTEPVLAGLAKADGIRLRARAMHPSEMFWRQMKHQEFDVSEMSLAALFMQRARGDSTWVGLPVFTARRFFHSHVLVRRGAGISSPADLGGRRVGVPEYQQTAAVWARGVLQDDFEVQPKDIRWLMERPTGLSHSALSGFKPPAGIDLVTAPDGASLAELLAAGELDALLVHLGRPNLVDVGDRGVDVGALTVPLFRDRLAETARYWGAHGIYPANHCLVIRRTLVDDHPELLVGVFALFADAKRRALRGRRDFLESAQEFGILSAELSEAVIADRMPYGTTDTAMQGTLSRYAFEQGLTRRVVEASELFEPAY
jgi:4,5-dihydroxyphthalate decarboxylase